LQKARLAYIIKRIILVILSAVMPSAKAAFQLRQAADKAQASAPIKPKKQPGPGHPFALTKR